MAADWPNHTLSQELRPPYFEEAVPPVPIPAPTDAFRSTASRHYFVNMLTSDASLGMMLFNRLAVWCIQNTIDSVFLFAKQYVVVRYSKLIWWSILQRFQSLSRKWLHGVSIDELRHGRSLPSTRFRVCRATAPGRPLPPKTSIVHVSEEIRSTKVSQIPTCQTSLLQDLLVSKIFTNRASVRSKSLQLLGWFDSCIEDK